MTDIYGDLGKILITESGEVRVYLYNQRYPALVLRNRLAMENLRRYLDECLRRYLDARPSATRPRGGPK